MAKEQKCKNGTRIAQLLLVDDEKIIRTELYVLINNKPTLFAVGVATSSTLLGVFILQPDGKILRYGSSDQDKLPEPCSAAQALLDKSKK